MGAQHSVWPGAGTPHVATSLPRASAGLFSHQPSTPALPTSRGVEECTLESALEAENTPLLLLFLGTVLLSPCPSPPANGGGDPSEPGPSCKWGGPADSPHSAITFFPRDLNPAVISSLANLWGACKQSLRDGVGRPGQDTEWRLVATPCLRPRAGIEASALLLTKPVSRDQCLEGLGQEQGGFCVLM